jgi:cytochrome c-type biogenesis protein CcmE
MSILWKNQNLSVIMSKLIYCELFKGIHMNGNDKKGLNSNQIKFLVSGGLFIIAVIILIISATKTTAEFFLTVKELQASQEDFQSQNIRVSGAVIGDSIQFDPNTGYLHFTIAHIPADDDLATAEGELSKVLHQAVSDPNNPRLEVVYEGAKPDMLRDESQAILTGRLDPQGVFIAEELLLKCPSKYEEALPGQAE